MTIQSEHVATLRPFEPARDFPAVTKLIGEVNADAGVDWFPSQAELEVEWSPTRTFDPLRDIVLAEDADQVVGLARVSWREREGIVVHRVEVWVHPDRTRRGIGTQLRLWGEARARASAIDGSGGPSGLPHAFGSMTSQGNPAGMAFAAKGGYRPIRYHDEMRRDLSLPIPDVPMPAGLEVRPVVPEHYRAIWLADEEAFRDHWDAAVVSEDDFVQFFAHPSLDPSMWQVAWDGDQVAGLVINAINHEENELLGLNVGWLESVATRRPWRRRGLAGALIARSLAVLRERGMEIAALGVDTENPSGARGLYQAFGFEPIRTWVFLRKPFDEPTDA